MAPKESCCKNGLIWPVWAFAGRICLFVAAYGLINSLAAHWMEMRAAFASMRPHLVLGWPHLLQTREITWSSHALSYLLHMELSNLRCNKVPQSPSLHIQSVCSFHHQSNMNGAGRYRINFILSCFLVVNFIMKWSHQWLPCLKSILPSMYRKEKLL